MNQQKLLKKLKNKCKKLWRQRVLERWGSKCAVCGATKLPNCHHILPWQMFGLLRYDVINSIVLCPTHHKFGKFSAHKNPLWFVDLLKLKMKPEDLDYLDRMMYNNKVMLFDVYWYQEMIERLSGVNEQIIGDK